MADAQLWENQQCRQTYSFTWSW